VFSADITDATPALLLVQNRNNLRFCKSGLLHMQFKIKGFFFNSKLSEKGGAHKININQQNIFMKKFEWLQIEAFCNGSEGLHSLLG
jgi:hypothetical protein